MIKYLVPDGKHLPYTGDDGKPDHRLMGAAWAALHGGYRGNKYQGPDKDKAISKLRGIYKAEGMTPPGENDAAKASELICRGMIDAPKTASAEMMYLPGGLHSISPMAGGVGKPITILVDRSAADAIEAQRAQLVSNGKRPFFDHNHSDDKASFWPVRYYWKDLPKAGVYAQGDWTNSGKSAIE